MKRIASSLPCEDLSAILLLVFLSNRSQFFHREQVFSEASTYRFEFKSQVQGGLMVDRPFFVRARQACLDEAQIESGEFSCFDCGHDVATTCRTCMAHIPDRGSRSNPLLMPALGVLHCALVLLRSGAQPVSAVPRACGSHHFQAANSALLSAPSLFVSRLLGS